MSDKDTTNDDEVMFEEEPRRSKGLIGRFFAVGLFIALGTFAVIQSLGRDKPSDAGQGGESGSIAATTTAAGTTLGNAGAVTLKTQVDIARIGAGRNGLGSANVKPGVPVRSGFSSASNVKPPTTLKRTTPRPGPKPPIVVAAKPATTQSFPARPTAKPPERFAQLGDSPIGRFNTGGTTAPKPPAIKVPAAINNAAASTANGFAALKNKAADTTSNVISGVREGAEKATDAASSTASRFGDTLRRVELNPKPPQAKPQSPFTSGPPATKAPDSFTRKPPSVESQRPGGFSTGSFASTPPAAKPPTNNPSSGFSGQSLRPAAPAKPVARPSSFASSPFQDETKPIKKPAPAPIRSFDAARPATAGGSNSAINRSSNTLTGNRSSIPVTARASDTPGDRAWEGVQAPALTIERLSPREVQLNATADFEIIVKNVGRVDANEVRVLDRVPAGTEFISANPQPTQPPRDGRLQWDLGTLEPGQEKRIVLQIKPTQPGEIGSVAQVVFAAQASMRTRVTKPVLEIRHETGREVLIGDSVVLDVVVENKGDGPANEVIIQETVPQQLAYSDGSRELEYEIGTLMPGQSRRVQLGLRAASVGKLRNVMFASAKGGLKAQHELNMEVIAPDLKTIASGPTRRFLEREVTHKFTIENHGTAKATNVDLYARLPSGLRFVSANNRGRYDSTTHAVIWSMPELTAGVSGDVELTTMPVESGDQPIKFEAEADLNLKSSSIQQLVVEHLIDVFFDIDDITDPIEVGAQTGYKIRVVNQGTKTATNVRLQVDFPPGLEPTGVEGNLRNQIQGQKVLFESISSMRPGDELQVTVKASGTAPGDHRVVVNMKADDRETLVSKEETTRVYSDR